MRYTYADWLSDHAAEKKAEEIGTVTTGQLSIVEEETVEPETFTTVASAIEKTSEGVIEITGDPTEGAPADEASVKETAGTEEARPYKHRNGYHSKH